MFFQYNKTIMKSLTYILIALATPALALSPTAPIQHINNQILAIKDNLTLDKQQQQDQQIDLQTLETKLATISLSYHKTMTQLAQVNEQINALKTKAMALQAAAESLKNQLIASLTIEYRLGGQPDLKILLGQDDITKAERLLTYYQYINAKRIIQINTLKQTLLLTQQNLAGQQQSYQSLNQLKTQELQQLRAMRDISTKRKFLINTINTQIQTQSQQLTALLANKQRLESEVQQLSQNPVFYQVSGKSFSALAHRLNWPTKGALINNYNTQIDGSQLKWNSVLFNAAMDQPVYAVADGKVIFARWLQGYGLLMIIYHGQGYITLYGRNHYLYKKEGDIVRAGDQIAAVGDSGGYNTPALYFAIRHNTLPVNPIDWLRRS